MFGNTMKKLAAFGTAAAITAASITSLAATQFTDLSSEHWAYPAISTLVAEGTISGYPDGTFNPGATVTRAEFVKMIGTGTENGKKYNDIDSSHWAYDYISTSELEGDADGNFNPNRPITRGETIYPMYVRAGKPSADDVPAFISAQGGEGTAWVYEYGIMVGNDGLNLRLDDTITRAEAAALIIKARNAKTPIGFTDTVSADILKYAYNSANIFDTAYSPDKTITYGEFSRAALRLDQNCRDLDYSLYSGSKTFEHAYALDLAILGKLGLDASKASESAVNTPVTRKDAKAIFDIIFKRRTGSQPDISLKLDISGSDSSNITCREIAAMLIQYDEAYGIVNSYYSDTDANGKPLVQSLKLEKSFDLLPSEYNAYAYIIKGVPSNVYKMPDKIKGEPKDIIDFASLFAPMFTNRCDTFKKLISSEYGIDADVIFNPSLTYDTGSGFGTTVKVVIKNTNGTSASASEMFGSSLLSCSTGDAVENGAVIYVKMIIANYSDLLK